MKTALDLNDTLLAEAKATAARQRTTLTRLIDEGLQLRLRKQRTPPTPVHLPVYHGKGGLVVGVDPLSNKALLDAADYDFWRIWRKKRDGAIAASRSLSMGAGSPHTRAAITSAASGAHSKPREPSPKAQ